MTLDRDRVHLADMVQAVTDALDFTAGVDESAFLQDRMRAAAVCEAWKSWGKPQSACPTNAGSSTHKLRGNASQG